MSRAYALLDARPLAHTISLLAIAPASRRASFDRSVTTISFRSDQLPPHTVPARFSQDQDVSLIHDGPVICAMLRGELVRFGRDLSDVDGPFRVDCLDHLAFLEHAYLQHGPYSLNESTARAQAQA